MDKQTAEINIGILAHVDAGKTTLAEALLYLTGQIRSVGRVDHGDAFLDTDLMEKQRGITIFSKQARFSLGQRLVTLLDTPGHTDFSAEMERTLQVLDYALLVISASDGVTGHVMTLWKLLGLYQIPTVIFVNKMDLPDTDRDKILRGLREKLDQSVVAFPADAAKWDEGIYDLTSSFAEEIASCDEELLDWYLTHMEEPVETVHDREKSGGGMPYITADTVRELICSRKVFPCFFGSALKLEGIDELIRSLEECLTERVYPKEFGARVFKISRDGTVRLTHMKITGGTLRVKDEINCGDRICKADQIRLYSGAGYRAVSEAGAGCVCAVAGLTGTYAGEGLGFETENDTRIMEPVMTYSIILPEGTDIHTAYTSLMQIEEEIPELHISLARSASGETINAQLMGQVQIEILTQMIRDRLGMNVSFSQGSIVYRETIVDTVEGVGHYEPLRHYAEVHLIMTPGERGSGVTFESAVSTDDLDLNWQRLILTHLGEKVHTGVLTGSALTDVHMILTAGRAHLKHTEGGDFRQATYRAVRHGLMQAASVLLEPYYSFRIEVPPENIGRVISDIQNMQGSFEGPFQEGEESVLTGTAPVAGLQDYETLLRSFTSGRGRIMLENAGYAPCHNAQEVIEQIGYDAEADTDNPAGSIFCSHGAGMYVPWEQVTEYMHLPAALPAFRQDEEGGEDGGIQAQETFRAVSHSAMRGGGAAPAFIDDDEMKAIFARTFSANAKTHGNWKKSRREFAPVTRTYGQGKPAKEREKVLLVDGYNIIYAWEELRELAEKNIDSARLKLMDILSNYQGFAGMKLILVFDAYKVSGGQERTESWHNIFVVYTREAETADAYIERTVRTMDSRSYEITVATSDAAEQIIIFGAGARRLSARNLKQEIVDAVDEMRTEYLKRIPGGKAYPFEKLLRDL